MTTELNTPKNLARLIIESVMIRGGEKTEYSPQFLPLVGAVKRSRQGEATATDTMLMLKHSTLVKFIK